MTFLCAALVAVAVGLLLRPPAARGLSRLRPADDARPAASARRWAAPLVTVLGAALAVVAGAVAAGPPGAVVAGAATIVCCTGVRLTRLRRRGRTASTARVEVAHACRVLAGQLRVGRIPAEALRVAAVDCPVLSPGAALLDLGSDPVPRWRHDALLPGHNGLLVLARAWEVSTRSGSPLAPALERVSEALSEDVAIERLVFGEVSAARATGKIMAALPLCGIGIGYVIGGRPLHFLVSGPLGWGCLLGGVLLAAAGVLWIDWLSRSVLESQAVQ
jgi:tight adherence protein B